MAIVTIHEEGRRRPSDPMAGSRLLDDAFEVIRRGLSDLGPGDPVRPHLTNLACYFRGPCSAPAPDADPDAGRQLLNDLYDLMRKRLPGVASTDPCRETLARLLPELGRQLGRPLVTIAREED
jgi:hypothetical protein